jgi:hypothetical protein
VEVSFKGFGSETSYTKDDVRNNSNPRSVTKITIAESGSGKGTVMDCMLIVKLCFGEVCTCKNDFFFGNYQIPILFS